MQTVHKWSLKEHRRASLEAVVSRLEPTPFEVVASDHGDYSEPPRHFARPSHHNCTPPTRRFNYQLNSISFNILI